MAEGDNPRASFYTYGEQLSKNQRLSNFGFVSPAFVPDEGPSTSRQPENPEPEVERRAKKTVSFRNSTISLYKLFRTVSLKSRRSTSTGPVEEEEDTDFSSEDEEEPVNQQYFLPSAPLSSSSPQGVPPISLPVAPVPEGDEGVSSPDKTTRFTFSEVSAPVPEYFPVRRRSKLRRYRGIMLALVSSLISALMALLVKIETEDVFNSSLFKFQGALVPAIPLLIQKRYCSRKGPAVIEQVWPLTELKKLRTFGLVLLRSFFQCNALLLHFYSLKYLPLGDAQTIALTSSIFAAIMARMFLHEKCGHSTVVGLFLSLVGIVMIAKPPIIFGDDDFDSDVLIGSLLGLGGSFVSAISLIILRYTRRVHYSVTAFMYGAWGTVENLTLVLLIPGLVMPEHLTDWAIIGGLAILTLLGQIAIILALKVEQVGPISILKSCDLLFAFLFHLAIWRELPDKWCMIGMLVIAVAIVFVGLRKWVRSHPRGHPVRKSMRFFRT